VPFAVLTTGGDPNLLAHPLLGAAPRLAKPYRSAELLRSVGELRRADLRAQLARAKRHLAEGRERLARQLRLTRRLAAAGHEVALAKQLLRGIARSLRLMRAHRAYLRRQLEAE
jgi:hypothetical protein